MDRFAHHVVAAERERQVTDAAADLDARTHLFDACRGFHEVLGVVVVLLEPCRNRENVRIEDDVGRIDVGLLGEQTVGALADLDLARDGVGLTALVKRHHDHAGAVAPHLSRLVEKVGFAFLETDRIDDRLALHALESRLDHRPLRAVDHHRQAGDFGFGCDVVQELRHAPLGVEHAFVHVDVEDVGAAADLIECDLRRADPIVRLHQPREFL